MNAVALCRAITAPAVTQRIRVSKETLLHRITSWISPPDFPRPCFYAGRTWAHQGFLCRRDRMADACIPGITQPSRPAGRPAGPGPRFSSSVMHRLLPRTQAPVLQEGVFLALSAAGPDLPAVIARLNSSTKAGLEAKFHPSYASRARLFQPRSTELPPMPLERGR